MLDRTTQRRRLITGISLLNGILSSRIPKKILEMKLKTPPRPPVMETSLLTNSVRMKSN